VSRSLPGPRGLAQLSPLRRIFKDPAPVLDELRAAYGPVCGLGFGPARLALVGDPASIGELFAMPTTSFRWGHKFNVLGFVTGATSLVVSDGDDHRRRRGAVQGAFSRRRLNGWIPMIVEQADAAVDRLAGELAGETRAVDLYPVGRALVLEITVRAFFGERLAGRAAEIGALFQGPQDYLESPAVRQIPHPFPGTTRARVRADRHRLDAIIDAEIAACRRAPSGDPLDVLEALVQKGELSDTEIRDQVVTLIGAGYDTTAASLAWMLWCCSLAPDVWNGLRVEADEVFGALGATADEPARDHALLARLRQADRAMRETLRLHPAGVASPREAATDVTVAGYRIPEGTLILWSAHLAGRDPATWPDPLGFDPDRFVDPTPEQEAAAAAAWVPFGGGPRNCIGFALAQMELTLVISRLAQRLDVTPLAARAPRPKGLVVNRPTGGAPMRVTARRTDSRAPQRAR
jgi:cytochrome P450